MPQRFLVIDLVFNSSFLIGYFGLQPSSQTNISPMMKTANKIYGIVRYGEESDQRRGFVNCRLGLLIVRIPGVSAALSVEEAEEEVGQDRPLSCRSEYCGTGKRLPNDSFLLTVASFAPCRQSTD